MSAGQNAVHQFGVQLVRCEGEGPVVVRATPAANATCIRVSPAVCGRPGPRPFSQVQAVLWSLVRSGMGAVQRAGG
jgi:hypothetical protein